jgi:hypothetical protein
MSWQAPNLGLHNFSNQRDWADVRMAAFRVTAKRGAAFACTEWRSLAVASRGKSLNPKGSAGWSAFATLQLDTFFAWLWRDSLRLY